MKYLFLSLLLALSSCAKKEAQPVSEGPLEAPLAETAAPKDARDQSQPAAPKALDDSQAKAQGMLGLEDPGKEVEVIKIIDEMRIKQNCNRIMGCKGKTALLQYGKAILEPAKEALKTADFNSYWPFALMETLGQSKDAAASDILWPYLNDKRWDFQIVAARSLAYLGPDMNDQAYEALKAATKVTEGPVHDVVELLVRYARLRSGREEESAQALREKLVQAIPEEAKDWPAPQLDHLLRLIGDAQLYEASEIVHAGLFSGNRLATETAIKTAAKIRDTESLPFLLALLNDENPTLQRLSLSALSKITGTKHLSRKEEWQDWAKHRELSVPDWPRDAE